MQQRKADELDVINDPENIARQRREEFQSWSPHLQQRYQNMQELRQMPEADALGAGVPLNLLFDEYSVNFCRQFLDFAGARQFADSRECIRPTAQVPPKWPTVAGAIARVLPTRRQKPAGETVVYRDRWTGVRHRTNDTIRQQFNREYDYWMTALHGSARRVTRTKPTRGYPLPPIDRIVHQERWNDGSPSSQQLFLGTNGMVYEMRQNDGIARYNHFHRDDITQGGLIITPKIPEEPMSINAVGYHEETTRRIHVRDEEYTEYGRDYVKKTRPVYEKQKYTIDHPTMRQHLLQLAQSIWEQEHRGVYLPDHFATE